MIDYPRNSNREILSVHDQEEQRHKWRKPKPASLLNVRARVTETICLSGFTKGSTMPSTWGLKLSLTDVLIASLAAWRLTHLLWGEDGPWNCFVRLRKLAGSSIAGQILDCFYCLSIWIALPLGWWIGATWLDRAIAWMAISGAAILLERITSTRNVSAAPADWREDSASPPE